MRALRRRLRLNGATGVLATLVLAFVATPGTAAPRAGASASATATTASASVATTAHAPAHVVLLGDSVSEQAFGYLGGATGDAPTHLQRWSHNGWTIRDAADHAGAAVTSADTDVLVLAVGPNDAAPEHGGWNDDDLTRWRNVLDGAATDTCVAVVLPGWGAALHGTAWEQGLRSMRSDVGGLVAARRAAGSPTVELDWLRVVTAHPDYLAADGIHLANTRAAEARQALYWEGVRRCEALTGDPTASTSS